MTPRWKIRRGWHRHQPNKRAWNVYAPGENEPSASYFILANAFTHIQLWVEEPQ